MKYIKSFSALQIHCPIDTIMHKDMEQMRKTYKNLFPLATEKRSSEGKCWFRVQEPHFPCVHFHVIAASSCIPSSLNYATNLRLSVKSLQGGHYSFVLCQWLCQTTAEEHTNAVFEADGTLSAQYDAVIIYLLTSDHLIKRLTSCRFEGWSSVAQTNI